MSDGSSDVCSSDLAWCLGMSEPGAGSDLAALSTRAVVHDDHFIVTGQKIWTSGAQHADYCFCFVRTDPAAPKHRGISVLIVDLKIGRAACRARVCQSVSLSVVAVEFKKKKP